MIKLSMVLLSLFCLSLQFGTFLPQDLFQPLQKIVEPVQSFFPVSSYCTDNSIIDCATEIKSTLETCSKAIDQDLTDSEINYDCIVDAIQDHAVCVPCICGQAKVLGWNIIGC